MRKLATIRVIDSISPIEGAEKIELAHTSGWQCVVGKGQFRPGEAAVFFEIDSALDPDDERYAFLKDRCYKAWRLSNGDLIDECIRIRTIRCLGNISQGLFMPLSEFPELTGPSSVVSGGVAVDADLTEALHVRHYDEVREHAEIVGGKAQLSGNVKGSFPSHLVPKTDEERLQNLTKYFTTMKDVKFECTEKFDGASVTFGYYGGYEETDRFFVCSRNFMLKDECANLFWGMARKYEIQAILQQYHDKGFDLAVQAELVGPGVNSNRDQYTEHEIRVFRIYNITAQQWFTPVQRHDFCRRTGLPHVKVIRDGWKVFQDLTTMDDFLEFVKGKTDRGHEREGMVWKSEDGRVSFKVINNDYLLKEK